MTDYGRPTGWPIGLAGPNMPKHAQTVRLTKPPSASARYDSACPESGPAPSIIKQCTIFYRACPKSGRVPRSPKHEPVPSIFVGMIGHVPRCPSHFRNRTSDVTYARRQAPSSFKIRGVGACRHSSALHRSAQPIWTHARSCCGEALRAWQLLSRPNRCSVRLFSYLFLPLCQVLHFLQRGADEKPNGQRMAKGRQIAVSLWDLVGGQRDAPFVVKKWI